MRIAIIGVLVFGCQVQAQEFQHEYLRGVFRADLSWVADAVPGNEAEAALKETFERVIVAGEPVSELPGITDEFVRKVIRRYEDYWRSAFLEPAKLAEHEAALENDIATLLSGNNITVEDSDALETLSTWLNNNGYGHRGGRTTPLLDFMLWKDARTVDYEVELTDAVQPVTVHFLRDFQVRGWSYFGTFGRSSTGGWADTDALYCIEDAYDLESENFTNSYLRHEARHFADYALFPELGVPDLEYRAKLTELAFGSNQGMRLQHFARQGALSPGAPHAIANWNVADAIENSLDMTDSEIAALARQRLQENTVELVEAGRAEVVGVIKLPE